ncbi:MAG: hypothetical protein JKY93_01005 [Gammaproteobacteria bacterium]|nr:hypothetical protein [Gammaproteobacteria bacterium]
MKNICQWSKIKQIAVLANIPESTYRTWKNRGNIPPVKRDLILYTAKKYNIDLSDDNVRNPNSPDHNPIDTVSGHPEQFQKLLHTQTQEQTL